MTAPISPCRCRVAAPRVAAALGDRVRAVVSLGGPFDFGDCWDGLPALTRDTFRVRSRAADAVQARKIAATLDMDDVAADVVAPLLVVFGRRDRLIPWQQAEKLRDSVTGPAELLMLADGNHGCANVLSAHRYRTADWMAARLAA